MLNKFEHLSNGLTVIHCVNTQEDKIEEVYIDTDMFNYLKVFNVVWKIWNDSGNNEKIVGGSEPESGRVINLKRVVGEYLFGTEYHYTLLNNDYRDHRKCNIFKFLPGTGHSAKVRAIKKEKLAKLIAIQAKKDIDNTESINVQVLEYKDKILFIENNEVTHEIPAKYLEALISYTQNHYN